MFCRQIAFSTLLGLAVLTIVGCKPPGKADSAEDVKHQFSMTPNPPKVGSAVVTVELTGKDGKPVKGATLKLEGNMNHAGMTPVFADARETDPGKYQASLELTMGGDWFVLIDGSLADGRKLHRKVDVPGVKSK